MAYDMCQTPNCAAPIIHGVPLCHHAQPVNDDDTLLFLTDK